MLIIDSRYLECKTIVWEMEIMGSQGLDVIRFDLESSFQGNKDIGSRRIGGKINLLEFMN